MTAVQTQEWTIARSDTLSLHARAWTGPEAPRAVVVINHGFLAHSGQYDGTARELVARGFNVYAYDMRGHGKSGGDRYWVDTYGDCVNDLAAFVEQVRAREPGQQLFLYGHSAGGVISTVFVQQHAELINGFICASFAFEVPPPEFLLQALRVVGDLIPRAPLLSLNPADFSRDPAVVEAIRNDPLVIHEPGPGHTLAELIRAHDHLGKTFGEVRLPVFIIHGTADKATRPHGSQRFYDEAGSHDKMLRLYEDHVHDLLVDYGKEQVLNDIVAWINARVTTAH